MASADPIPGEALALFREPPEAFIAARDALSTHLREEGRSDDAKVVKALRKPTVVAWALNQLPVRDAEGVDALLEAGAEVRAAQQAALSSKRGATDRLRAASATRKGAVADLAAVALGAMTDAGKTADAHADAIVRALEASSVDPDAGAKLAAGALERPPAASAGFGTMLGLTSLEGGGDDGGAGTRRSGSRSDPAGKSGSARTSAGDRASKAESKAEVARSRRNRDAAQRRARKFRSAADGFAHELEGMRRRLEVVERKHADAEAAAGEAELEAARAERALQEATERLEGADD